MRVEVLMPFRAGCRHRVAALAAVSAWWSTAVPEWPVRVVDDGGPVFSRGGSLNLGVETSSADVFVAADADLLIGRAQILDAVEVAGSAPGLVQPFDRLNWYGAPETGVLLDAPHRAFYGPSPQPMWSWPVSASTPLLGGMNVLSRETWERSGGWPVPFRGWGHEDVVFAAQCRTLVGPHRIVSGTVHHLFHPKPSDQPYASAETIDANTREAERWMSADGDPAAMRVLLEEVRGG